MAGRKEIALAIEKALSGKMKKAEIEALLEEPPNPNMGDLAFPCFKLSPILKKAPQHIAEGLANLKLPKGVDSAKAAGPYLNFFLAKEGIAASAITTVLKGKGNYGRSAGKAQKIMVEYSAPNSNKPLHLGHLRNNSIGMAVAGILEASGNKVVKANLVNDRGIHICKSMLAFKLFGKESTPKSTKKKPDHFVGDYYVLFNQKVKEDPSLEDQAYGLLQKWEAKDKATMALWKRMTDWAVAGFKETYKEFGSRFDTWFFESELYDKATPLIKLGKKKGLFKENDEGALVAELEKHGLPNKTVLRADGTSIYITNDLALTKHKFEKFKLKKAYWVVGNEQDLYLKQVFKIFELLGFAWAKECRHLSHGMVFLPSGKLKSREGKVVDADEIIQEMEQLAADEIRKREEKISKKELAKRSRAIGLAAIKFHMLKVAVQKDLLFNPEESISFEGETGPYIQYTHARAKSILRKAKKYKKPASFDKLSSSEEQRLAKLLAAYPKAVAKALEQLSPHVVCQFLIETAEAFNSFYHKHPVLKAGDKETMAQRLALVEATAQVLKNGLEMLDIEAIEKM
jgi:arginyl-tRNA synthetase